MFNKEKLDLHRIQTKIDLDKALDAGQNVFFERPCGYGKTYLIVQECCERLGEKIIIEPTKSLIHYLDKYKEDLQKNNSQIFTYAFFLHKDKRFLSEKFNNVKYIFVDEAHRLGAKQWGKAFLLLKEVIPQAQIVGISATPIRMDGIDVRNDIFENIELPSLNLADAILEDLLPNPNYISSLYAIDEYMAEELDNIGKSNILDEDEKVLLIDEIKQSMLQYDKLYNIPNILQKNILKFCDYHRNMKFITFVKDITDGEDAIKNVNDWFNQAFNFLNKKVNIYFVHYKKDEKNKIEIDNFENNKDKNSIDIMIAVNMFNEGIHLDNINGVILLRKTKSDIIYYQQIGRCLDANIKTPLIFDFVNNIKYLEDGFIRLIIESAKNRGLLNSGKVYTCSGDIVNIYDEQINFLETLTQKINNRITKELTEEDKEILRKNCSIWTISKASKIIKKDTRKIRDFAHQEHLEFLKTGTLITKDEIDTIVRFYRDGLSVAEIIKKINRSESVIRKVLLKNNMYEKGNVRTIIEKSKKDFIISNVENGYDFLISNTGLKKSQIWYVLNQNNLTNKLPNSERPDNYNPKVSQKEIDFVIKNKDKGYKFLQNKLNRCYDFIKKIADENNIEIKKEQENMSKDIIEQINKLYDEDNNKYSPIVLSNMYGFGVSTIRSHLKNLKTNNIKKREEHKNKIVKYIQDNYDKCSIKKIAEMSNSTFNTVKSLMKELELYEKHLRRREK